MTDELQGWLGTATEPGGVDSACVAPFTRPDMFIYMNPIIYLSCTPHRDMLSFGSKVLLPHNPLAVGFRILSAPPADAPMSGIPCSTVRVGGQQILLNSGCRRL
jgi:hypothetical protein